MPQIKGDKGSKPKEKCGKGKHRREELAPGTQEKEYRQDDEGETRGMHLGCKAGNCGGCKQPCRTGKSSLTGQPECKQTQEDDAIGGSRRLIDTNHAIGNGIRERAGETCKPRGAFSDEVEKVGADNAQNRLEEGKKIRI